MYELLLVWSRLAPFLGIFFQYFQPVVVQTNTNLQCAQARVCLQLFLGHVSALLALHVLLRVLVGHPSKARMQKRSLLGKGFLSIILEVYYGSIVLQLDVVGHLSAGNHLLGRVYGFLVVIQQRL